MSIVTNVILTFSLEEEGNQEEDFPALNSVNAWIAGREYRRVELLERVADLPGRKRFEQVICVGCFNHLDVDAFKAAVANAPWQDPENVQLFVQEQEQDRFELFTVADCAHYRAWVKGADDGQSS